MFGATGGLLSTAHQLNEIRHEMLAGKIEGPRRAKIARLVASLRREQPRSRSTSPAFRDASTELPAVSDSDEEEDFDSDCSPLSHAQTASAGNSPHGPSLASANTNTEHREQHDDVYSFFRRVKLTFVQ